MNAKKGNLDEKILDPFEVQDGWFEVLLPSLQLVTTDAIPHEHRQRAEFTLKRLGLCDEQWAIDERGSWYEMYQEGELNLKGVERSAPLIARAVRKQIEAEP